MGKGGNEIVLESLLFCSIEVILLVLVTALFLCRIFLPSLSPRTFIKISLLGTFGALMMIPMLWERQGLIFQSSFKLDQLALLFKALFLASAFFLQLIAGEFSARLKSQLGEFSILMTLAVLGACCLVSANDFLTFFVSLELMTISLYILTAFLKSDARSLEAGTKYLIMGAFSSAILLYGIVLIYGSTGSFNFDAIHSSIMQAGERGGPGLFLFGALLIIAGIGFKVGVFPFQLWVPDVYEGAPLPVTAFLSVVSKSAGFAALIRILLGPFGTLHANWTVLAGILAALTLLYGNLGAIPQVKGNIKRLMGYSSIGHAGYLLMGIASGRVLGIQAMLYYLFAYAAAGLVIFLVLAAVSNQNESIASLRGLLKRSPLAGASLFIAFLSLAGVPPLGGFFGKFMLIKAALDSHLLWLAMTGALVIAVSLFYYLMVIKTAYVDDAPSSAPIIQLRPSTTAALFILCAFLIFLGIFQNPLVELIREAVV